MLPNLRSVVGQCYRRSIGFNQAARNFSSSAPGSRDGIIFMKCPIWIRIRSWIWILFLILSCVCIIDCGREEGSKKGCRKCLICMCRNGCRIWPRYVVFILSNSFFFIFVELRIGFVVCMLCVF